MVSSHQPIWALPVNEVYESLGSAVAGLEADEAFRRLQKFGVNETQAKAEHLLCLRLIN
jgi:Cation transporter/ATPase, N-terminus